ncbi:hypothetical protein BGP_2340 [Beggiatoa sp. PS]|nr:hypothetical protein BGP_2340 [Beggiatoa sp. PS]
MNIPNSHVSQEQLSDYLNALALDPKRLAIFRRDPQAALANSSLSDAEKSVVASCDEARLHHAISKGELSLAITVVTITVASGGNGRRSAFPLGSH